MVRSETPAAAGPEFLVRPAEMRDVPRINELIASNSSEQNDLFAALAKRYGHCDVSRFIDVALLSVVAADPVDDRVYGFMALDHFPIPEVLSIPAGKEGLAQKLVTGDWASWLRERYACNQLQLHNTKFLHFFFAHPPMTTSVLKHSLAAAFAAVPEMQNLGYLLPDSVLPFPPLITESEVQGTKAATRRKKKPAAPPAAARKRWFRECTVLRQDEPFSFLTVSRDDVSPKLIIRDARVEDCDDLVPMFRKQKILDEEQGDFYLAQLLESRSESSRTLVAEASGGVVVGFMSLSINIDYAPLLQLFHLDAYDSLTYETAELYAKSITESRPPVARRQSQLPASAAFVDTVKGKNEQTAGESGAAEGQESVPPPPPWLNVPESIEKAEPEGDEAPALAAQSAKDIGNAFAVTLFCIGDAHATQGGDFLGAAFASFPDRDYCLLSIRSTMPDIPLLRHFVKVPCKQGMSPGHCLYIASRYGSSGVLSVRPALQADVSGIKELVAPLPSANEMLAQVSRAVGHDASKEVNPRPASAASAPDAAAAADAYPDARCFVAECHNVLVGLAVVDSAELGDVDGGFDVEEFIMPSQQKDRGGIKWLRRLVVNPLFAHQLRWLLEEVLRQSRITTLYYSLDAASQRDPTTRSLVISEFLPVRRRRRIRYPQDLNDGKPEPPSRLYPITLFTKSLICDPKVTVNARIVVIGGSDAGLSILEHLVYRSHLHFTNLTLISTEGVPTFDEAKFFVTGRCFTSAVAHQLGLSNYVRVVRQLCTNIDREHRACRLKDGTRVAYDTLILAPGLQFHLKDLFADSNAKFFANTFAANRNDHRRIAGAVAGFAEGKRRTAAAAPNASSSPETTWAVVWGSNIQAYALIQGLVEAGGDPARIAHVVPVAEKEDPSVITGNAAVDGKIHQAIKQLGITVYSGFTLKSHDATRSSLNRITIQNEDGSQQVTLPVCVFLYADKRTINPYTFRSVNDSCLVFDGHLVVDRYFHTQDPMIYAAGSVTKYSSKYRTRWLHEYCDSREVGAKIANKVLSMYDPLMRQDEEENTLELPRFAEAKQLECYLPGGNYYLHFDKPRLPGLTLEQRKQLAEHGRELVTDVPADGRAGSRYFRIHLGPQGYIESVTYFGTHPIPSDNIVSLYGLHEMYLNRLAARFDERIIPDFVSFFEGTWAMPIFHDEFRRFATESRREMTKSGMMTTAELLERLRPYLEKGGQVPEDERKAMYTAFDMSPDRILYEKKIKHYLRYTGFPSE